MLYRPFPKNPPEPIATGIFAHIALQVTLNIGVVTGMLPTTGVTFPFISYGGTAIVILLAEMGIALENLYKIDLHVQEQQKGFLLLWQYLYTLIVA